MQHAYQVPGTPRGVGEQHVHIMGNGTTVLLEVVEYEDERRAVVRHTPADESGSVSLWRLDPARGGCELSYAARVDLPPTKALSPQGVKTIRQYQRDVLLSIRRILLADERP